VFPLDAFLPSLKLASLLAPDKTTILRSMQSGIVTSSRINYKSNPAVKHQRNYKNKKLAPVILFPKLVKQLHLFPASVL
jgi:hypothetical protein